MTDTIDNGTIKFLNFENYLAVLNKDKHVNNAL